MSRNKIVMTESQFAAIIARLREYGCGHCDDALTDSLFRGGFKIKVVDDPIQQPAVSAAAGQVGGGGSAPIFPVLKCHISMR